MKKLLLSLVVLLSGCAISHPQIPDTSSVNWGTVKQVRSIIIDKENPDDITAPKVTENPTSNITAVEITVKVDSGPDIIVIQPFDSNYYTPGSKVRVITTGNNKRVTF